MYDALVDLAYIVLVYVEEYFACQNTVIGDCHEVTAVPGSVTIAASGVVVRPHQHGQHPEVIAKPVVQQLSPYTAYTQQKENWKSPKSLNGTGGTTRKQANKGGWAEAHPRM